MTRAADAVVVGGGVMGTSIAYHLARVGMDRVVLLEKKFLAAGGTGKSTAVIRMHYDNEPEARMVHAAFPVFQNWEDVVGGTCDFVSTGFLMIVRPEDTDKLRANVAMQQRVGINTRLVTADEVREIAPAFYSDDLTIAAYEPDSGYADPAATTYGFARAARERGAELHQGVTVTRVAVEGGRVTGVSTDRGRVSSPVVVLAAGAWSVNLARPLGVELPITPERHQVATLQRPFDVIGGHPTVIDAALGMYFRPESEHLTLVGTGAGEPGVDPDNYNEAVDPDFVTLAARKISRRVPAMERGLFRGGWSGVYDVTPDGKPILGAVGPEGLYVAAGFSGTGFKLSPAIGLTMAELITEGRATTVDLTPFRLSRWEEGEPLHGEHAYSLAADWWSKDLGD